MRRPMTRRPAMLALVLLLTAIPGARAGSPDTPGLYPGHSLSHTGTTGAQTHNTPSGSPGAHPGHSRFQTDADGAQTHNTPSGSPGAHPGHSRFQTDADGAQTYSAPSGFPGAHFGHGHFTTDTDGAQTHGAPSGSPGAHPGHDRAHTPETLRTWRAGEKVSEQDVAQYGIDRCFTGSEIDDALFGRICGKSYKANCTVPRSELRYLRVLHRNTAGDILLGELVCNEAISGDLLEIFRTLYDAAYPIERMVLVDEYDAQDGPSMRANNSSAFNFRFIAGTTKLSDHSLGMAVDINPLYNPCVRVRGGRMIVDPAEAAPYADRTRDFPYKIGGDDLCCREFIRHGFIWGGHWKSLKDYQHFEKAK